MLAAHADWSMAPGKRWFAWARPGASGWEIAAPEPVGALGTFGARLRGLGAGPVALGVDLPLGLPRAYVTAHLGEGDFPAFLKQLGDKAEFFAVCETLAEVGPGRPFYPRRGLAGMRRAAHAAALGVGGPEGLSRLCDRATAIRPAGAPLFWTLGANQTGKSAITAWRDWLIPALLAGEDIGLWPFMGDFRALLDRHALVVAETYPAEVMRHLGLVMPGSKRRQADRAGLAAALRAAMARLGALPCPALATEVADGFGSDAAGEDRFDCVIGLLGVLNVLAGNRPDLVPDDPWLRRWEGWVLGQTELPGASNSAT